MDPYSSEPIKWKRLTTGQMRDLMRAKEDARLSWRSAFTLVRRGLVIVTDKPSVLECLIGMSRTVALTPAGEKVIAEENRRVARIRRSAT